MEDLTLWKIHDKEFILDLGDADTLDRYDAAMEQLKSAASVKNLSSSAAIRAYCAAFRSLYDALLGDGAAAQIFAGVPDNVRKYNAVYAKFLAFVSKQAASVRNEMADLRRKYIPKGGKH